MAERSYFSHRWAIPGYTIILLIITINYGVLVQSLEQEPAVPKFSEIFFGFLALLSGSGIGFLVSQIWHWWCEYQCLYYGAPRKPYKTLIELYELEKGEETREDKRRISAVWVYLLNYGTEQKKFPDPLTRRWDLYNLFGSERTSLLMGLTVGWAVRIISHLLLNKHFTFQGPLVNWLTTTEFWLLSISTALCPFFFILLGKQRNYVEKKFDLIAEPYIKNIHKKIKRDELLKIFRRKYFNWPLSKIQIPTEYEKVLNEVGIVSVHQLSKYNIKKDPKKILLKISQNISKKELIEWIQKAREFLEKYEKCSHACTRKPMLLE